MIKISSCGNSKQNINGKWHKTTHNKYAHDMSKAYNALSPEAQSLLQKAVELREVSNHRTLRVQHILAANGNQEAKQQLAEYPVESQDAPRDYGNTVMRAIRTAFGWSQEWNMQSITVELLVGAVEAQGIEEEIPFGRENINVVKDRLKSELGIADQIEPNMGNEQTQSVDENMRRQVIDTALQQLQQGMPSNTVAMQFLSDMMNIDPNFANGPYAMMVIAVQNNPQQLAEFLQGFNS